MMMTLSLRTQQWTHNHMSNQLIEENYIVNHMSNHRVNFSLIEIVRDGFKLPQKL